MQRNSQTMERLFTLLMSGAYGAILTWMFVANYFGLTRGERTLISLVTPWIQVMVLIGGIFLLVLFFIKLFTFKSGGDGHHHDHDNAEEGHDCCGHDHDHDHAHDHDHPHDHDHAHTHHDHHHHEHKHEHKPGEACCDHGHDHGWNPIRYIPLLVPMILYFMGLPDDRMIRNFERNLAEKAVKGSSADIHGEEDKAALSTLMLGSLVSPNEVFPTTTFVMSIAGAVGSVISDLDDDASGEPAYVTDLAVLEKAGEDPHLRTQLSQKRKVQVDGMFQMEGSNGTITLFRVVRLRMACCLSDARPATVAYITKKPIDERVLKAGTDTRWVNVQGKLRFMRGKDGKYQAVMKVSKVEAVPFPPFPYLT